MPRLFAFMIGWLAARCRRLRFRRHFDACHYFFAFACRRYHADAMPLILAADADA